MVKGKSLAWKYFLYILRWQGSTPILAICMFYLPFGITWNTVASNFVGAILFFWIDMLIFKKKAKRELWEVSSVPCFDCQATTRTYRLVSSPRGYDRTEDPDPEFRCETCSIEKRKRLEV